MYALFKDGKQISKAHSSRIVCEIEAFELGVVVQGSKGFGNEPDSVEDKVLLNGYNIMEVG